MFYLTVISLLSVSFVFVIPTNVHADPALHQLQLGEHGVVPWSINNIKPGDHGIDNLTLRNTGSTDGQIAIWITNIAQYDFAGDGAHLGDYMLFEILGPGLISNVEMPSNIYSMPSSAEGNSYIWLLNLHAQQEINIEWYWEFKDTLAQQNDAQGDALRFDINYALGQPNPPSGMRWLDVDMLGWHTWGLLNENGSAAQTIEAWDEAGSNSLIIEKGTYCLCDGNKSPLSGLKLDYQDDVPPYPLYQALLSSSYFLQGYHSPNEACSANFSGKTLLCLSYDPAKMPMKTVVIGLYQFNDTEWTPMSPPPNGDLFLGRASGVIKSSGSFAAFATFNTSGAPCFVAGKLNIQLNENRLFEQITFIKDVARSITVTVTVTNVGEVQGTETLFVTLNNQAVASREVTLGPLARMEVMFTISDIAPGDYRLEVAGLSERFSVGTYVDWSLITIIVWLIATIIAFVTYSILRWRSSESRLKAAENVINRNTADKKAYQDALRSQNRGSQIDRKR